MNTLLNLIQMYKLGKDTGLAGIMGILSCILAVKYWDYIKPIFLFFGFDKLLIHLGLMSDEPILTIYNIVCAIIAFYICAFVAVAIIMVIVAIFSALIASETTIGLVLAFSPIIIIMAIIFFPFTIAWLTAVIYGHIERIVHKFTRREEIAEKICLQKNANAFRIMKYINTDLFTQPKEVKKIEQGKAEPVYNNEISVEEALKTLNFLPNDENHYIIGGTYERELYLLFPCPNVVRSYFKDNDYLYGVKLNVLIKDEQTKLTLWDKVNLSELPINMEIKGLDYIFNKWNSIPEEFNMNDGRIKFSDFEVFFDIRYNENAHCIKETLYKFNHAWVTGTTKRNDYWKSYMDHVYRTFNYQYAKLEHMIEHSKTDNEKEKYQKELVKYKVGNLDIANLGIRSAKNALGKK